VIVLLLIIAFSLGVEKGRRSSYLNADNNKNLSKEISTTESNPQNLTSEGKNEEKKIEEKVSNMEIREKREETSMKDTEGKKMGSVKQGYVIQVASYSKEGSAQEEAKKIQNKGFPAFISKKNNFVAVFVGAFKTKEEAEKNMGLLKKIYKDCILRRL
jgi:cell division septation protein DedD